MISPAGYGNSKTRTESRQSGYSTGVYSTWHADNVNKTGLFVDSWAQYCWFNNSVNGQNLNTEKYKSKGMTASVESGYTFKVGQLLYAAEPVTSESAGDEFVPCRAICWQIRPSKQR
nr:autotransporter outer membrane beta-barrel domain-containing protein [Yersinia frederiksenii]